MSFYCLLPLFVSHSHNLLGGKDFPKSCPYIILSSGPYSLKSSSAGCLHVLLAPDVVNIIKEEIEGLLPFLFCLSFCLWF